MTTDTLTLTDFLLARIEEDEAIARSFDADPRRIFENHGGSKIRWYGLMQGRPYQEAQARVLAECAAKRAILRQHDAETFDEEPLPWDAWHCGDCGNLMPCPTLRALAAVYAGHDGYRAEWAL